MSRPKKTSRPNAVRLGTKRKTFATAYAHHPPTKKHPLWGWRMTIPDPLTSKPLRVSLGRLAREKVSVVMTEKFKELDKTLTALPGPKFATVEQLLRAWYQQRVLSRGPDSSVREEYRYSIFTIRNYKTAIQNVIDAGGKCRLEDLNENTVEQLQLRMQKTLAPRTIHLAMGRLRLALKWARKTGVKIPDISVSCRRPRRGKEYVTNRYTPTDEEVMELLDKLPKSTLKLAVFIGFKTGARTGEIAGLKWNDIYEDRQGCWIAFNGKTGKRVYPISREVMEQIHGFCPKDAGGDARLFGRHYHKNGSTYLRQACVRHGLPAFTFYGLRRLRVDSLHRQGIEPAVYEKLMGHSTRMAREVYRQCSARDLQEVIEKPKQQEEQLLMALVGKLGLSMEEVLRKLLV